MVLPIVRRAWTSSWHGRAIAAVEMPIQCGSLWRNRRSLLNIPANIAAAVHPQSAVL
jgi:hypothetical protein